MVIEFLINLRLTDYRLIYLFPLYYHRYIINFLLDSTIGLFIIYVGIRVSIYLAKVKHWPAIEFGEYSK